MKHLGNVNRIEIIDHTKNGEGREFVKWVKENFKVEYDVQDEGRTIKMFITEL